MGTQSSSWDPPPIVLGARASTSPARCNSSALLAKTNLLFVLASISGVISFHSVQKSNGACGTGLYMSAIPCDAIIEDKIR